MLAVSMPNFFTSDSFVLSATKCFATCFASLARSRNQRRAEWALVMVSCVVKVFDATMNNVVSGLEEVGDESWREIESGCT